MQVGAVFGLILALIVMGFVLFVGSGQITNMICMGNIGQTNNAMNNLESIADDIQASGEGSSNTFKLRIPSGASICFIDPTDPSRNIANNWMPDPDIWPIIKSKIETHGYNVWIEYNCGTPESGYTMEYIVNHKSGQAGNFCADSGDTLLLTNVDRPEGVRVQLEKLQ